MIMLTSSLLLLFRVYCKLLLDKALAILPTQKRCIGRCLGMGLGMS